MNAYKMTKSNKTFPSYCETYKYLSWPILEVLSQPLFTLSQIYQWYNGRSDEAMWLRSF